MKGNIVVTENALASLLGLAAHEVPGVVGMASANLRQALAKILERSQARDGVTVTSEGAKRKADIHIVVGFGTNIRAVAENVRERMNYAAKNFAGIELTDVRVHVVGVSKTPNKKTKGGRNV